PATTAKPVVTSVSQATRPLGSCFITSSSTASEIWSAILSGCPSVTDSDVNKKLRNPSLKPALLLGLSPQTRAALKNSQSGYPVNRSISRTKNQRTESKRFSLASNGSNLPSNSIAKALNGA